MSDASRRTIRTIVQVTLGLAAGAPLLVETAGLPEALPGLGVTLGVAAAITRLMALPMVDQLLPAWLRAALPAAPQTAPVPPVSAVPDNPPAP